MLMHTIISTTGIAVVNFIVALFVLVFVLVLVLVLLNCVLWNEMIIMI